MPSDRPEPLSAADVGVQIEELLEQPIALSFTEHCRSRSHDRNFDVFDVRRVLEHGMPEAGDWDERHQNWTYRVAGRDFDNEPLTVIVVLEQNVLKVITAL